MIDWNNGNGGRSSLLTTAASHAFAMRLWASLFKELKKRPVVAILLALVLLHGSIRMADGDGFHDISLICCALDSMSLSPFDTSRDLAPDLPGMSMSRTKHALVGTRNFIVSLGTVVSRLRHFGSDGMSCHKSRKYRSAGG